MTIIKCTPLACGAEVVTTKCSDPRVRRPFSTFLVITGMSEYTSRGLDFATEEEALRRHAHLVGTE